MPANIRTIFISGHRNPDVDSIASAYALADLRKRLGDDRVQAICPGLLPPRAAWLFRHFNLTPPPSRGDVYLRVGDLLSDSCASVSASVTLYEGLKLLNASGEAAIPVTEPDGTFIGMLNPIGLLTQFLAITGENKGLSLAGRTVNSSTERIRDILKAETLCEGPEPGLRLYDVYVAAASPESFEARMDAVSGVRDLAIVCGDRPNIHQSVVARRIPLLIVTGDAPVNQTTIRSAAESGTTILRTRYDSGKVIRLLKFATPTGAAPLEKEGITLQSSDRVHDVRASVLHSPDNIFPVLDANRRLVGIVRKSDFTSLPPFRMIMVDHNETDQGIAGIDEIPVVEVVDHHRISFRPTAEPIKYTADVVGSTCTIVARMFRAAGLRPNKTTAGVLLCGLVSDTLLFQSPTTTDADREIAAWLEKICGESASSIMEGLLSVESPLSSMSPREAIDSDRKRYTEEGFRFALSQIEESNLQLFHRNLPALTSELDRLREEENLDFIALLVTDPVRGNSELVYRGIEPVRRALPYRHTPDGIFLLPGILSRKKQLLPELLTVLANARV